MKIPFEILCDSKITLELVRSVGWCQGGAIASRVCEWGTIYRKNQPVSIWKPELDLALVIKQASEVILEFRWWLICGNTRTTKSTCRKIEVDEWSTREGTRYVIPLKRNGESSTSRFESVSIGLWYKLFGLVGNVENKHLLFTNSTAKIITQNNIQVPRREAPKLMIVLNPMCSGAPT